MVLSWSDPDLLKSPSDANIKLNSSETLSFSGSGAASRASRRCGNVFCGGGEGRAEISVCWGGCADQDRTKVL